MILKLKMNKLNLSNPLNYKKNLFFFLVSIFFLTIVYLNIEIKEIFENFKKLDIQIILLGISLVILTYLFATLRWYLLISNITKQKNLFKICTKQIFIAATYNLIIPAKTGELSKLFFLNKLPKKKILSCLLLERAIDLTTLILVFIIFGIKAFGQLQSNIFFKDWHYIIVLIFVGVIIVLKYNPFKIINEIKKTFKKINNKIILIFLLSFSVIFFNCFFIYSMFSFFGKDINFAYILGIYPIIVVGTILISTPSGLGIREYLFILFFGNLPNTSLALNVSLIYYFFIFLLPAVIGLIIMKSYKNK